MPYFSINHFINTSAPGTRAIISKETLSQIHRSEESKLQIHKDETNENSTYNVSEHNEG